MENLDISDINLMIGIAGGDRQAFQQLYLAYSPLLLAIAMRITQRRASAEEIIQEVFIQVWQTASRYDSALSSPKTWLSHLVRNRAIDWLRARDNQWVDQQEAIAQSVELTQMPDKCTQDDEMSQRLLACMKHLPANQQQCIALAWYQGLSHGDIARYLNQPLGSVKSWVRKGLEHLKECVGL